MTRALPKELIEAVRGACPLNDCDAGSERCVERTCKAHWADAIAGWNAALRTMGMWLQSQHGKEDYGFSIPREMVAAHANSLIVGENK